MAADSTRLNTTPPAPRTLDGVVGATAARVQGAYLGEQGERLQARARGTLAGLRAAAGMSPESDPLAWQRVLDELLPDFPERFQGRGDAASPSERAAFDALTLFGLHMQSQRKRMHIPGRSFAKAAGLLVRKRASESIKPRFDAILTVRNPNTRRHHLRGLISLLRSEEIGFDYGHLALDVRRLDGDHRNRVLLAWGRDFAIGRLRQQDDGTTSND